MLLLIILIIKDTSEVPLGLLEKDAKNILDIFKRYYDSNVRKLCDSVLFVIFRQ